MYVALFPYSYGDQKTEIKVWSRPHSLKHSRGYSFLASSSFWCPKHSLAIWLQSLPLSSDGFVLSPCQISLCLSLIRTPVTECRAHTNNPGWSHLEILMNNYILLIINNYLFQIKVTFIKGGHIFLGGHHSIHYILYWEQTLASTIIPDLGHKMWPVLEWLVQWSWVWWHVRITGGIF